MGNLGKQQLEWLQPQVHFVLNKTRQNEQEFEYLVPPAASVHQIYKPEENIDWTASFWVGMLHLAKELTTSDEFDGTIDKQMQSFRKRLDNEMELETHDLGFLFTLSAMANYKITHNEDSEEMAMEAADLLMKRYSKKAKIIQAWGDLSNPDERGRMIIDGLMNLPLLYFASEVTGDSSYKEAAYNHAKQTQKYIVRPNYTTFHTYFFDTETGEALYGKTAQGYSDDSCWARGQAWGIYGFTLSYLYTGDLSFLESAKHVADYFLDNLPKDNVCYWDLVFNDGSKQERDSSAAAIAVCGLLELAKQLPITDEKVEHYQEAAKAIMKSLAKSYTTLGTNSNGLLLHGVYDKNSDKGVDECMIWGDYFYMEALIRLSQSWYKYW
jgi:unsaturated chondroitin disaccharide hydrolase